MHLAAEQFVTSCCHSSDPKSCSLSKWVRAGAGPGTNETRGSELQSMVLHREELRACGRVTGESHAAKAYVACGNMTWRRKKNTLDYLQESNKIKTGKRFSQG